ncbi:hypothetical protein Lgra_0539 [Legionella gratiana]|uniref:Uncharacterized protein n=1 Tax=Legionella gratiana TaxID=45066 RepID=A0A378J4R1_9GAMM|nr:hypothetical protein [Legionella gratiana]KTD14508.1 hypothetical protein Lgra_0539 [Legionella gratiana]STX41981.1 Uncharacterised protein [Legionella gratiana]
MKFFGSRKNKQVYNKLEDKTQKEVYHEDTSLKQIDAELKQLKKQRKKLTPPHSSQICASSFFIGVPIGIPPSYFATNNNINHREIMSLDRQIDRLEEARYRIMNPSTAPSR